jgi:pyruvate/2-oxoglutarate dehydrogenase complex dihydrolipoamide dehydrogenase (E3) component
VKSRYDLAVVGGGTAGLVAAFGAAGLGARVCLVERASTGGDCLWTGCVPSKSLIAAATLAHRMRTAYAVGLRSASPNIDLSEVMAHVQRAQATLAAHDSPERLRSAGVDVVEGDARFLGPGRMLAGNQEIRFRSALVATGSRPVLPPLPGLEHVGALTSETVWGLRELPPRLAVLGGGPVGCELGQAFGRLGSRVTLIENAGSLLPQEEPEAGELITDRLRSEGVDVRLGARVLRAEPGPAGPRLWLERAGVEEPVEVDRVLVAVGRRPATEGLGLETVGVATDDSGAVIVDDRLRTTARGIFGAGDVTGVLPFTHVAAYQSRTLLGNALFGLRRRAAYDALPWVTFTDPEVGRVGLTEAQARQRWGARAVVARFDYAGLDRAVCAGEAVGFAKLVANPKGRLVGATVVGPGGGEAMAELAARVATGGSIAGLSQAVHAYPTFSEGPARAADDYLRARWLNPRVRRLTRPALGLLRIVDRS